MAYTLWNAMQFRLLVYVMVVVVVLVSVKGVTDTIYIYSYFFFFFIYLVLHTHLLGLPVSYCIQQLFEKGPVFASVHLTNNELCKLFRQAIQDITRNYDVPPEDIVILIYEKIDIHGEGKGYFIFNPGIM